MSIYPNPARDKFEMEIGITERKMVKVDMLDASGRLVRVDLVKEELEKGRYKHVIELNNMAEGVYTLRIQIGDKLINKKLVIMR